MADVLFENVNAVANKSMTPAQWHASVVDAVAKIAEAN